MKIPLSSACLLPFAVHANLLLDGSFEPRGTLPTGIPDVVTGVAPHQRFANAPMPASFGAWSFTGNYYVDLMGSGYVDAGGHTWNDAHDGHQYLYIVDSYPLYHGSAAQSVSLTAGVAYELTFAQTDFPGWDGGEGWVRVTVTAGAFTQSQEYNSGNISNGAATSWLLRHFAFTVPGTGELVTTTVTFSSRMGNPAIIDSVNLEAVSVPEARSGAAVVLLGVAGLLAARRRR